jgi:hypothetical protein
LRGWQARPWSETHVRCRSRRLLRGPS